MSDEEENGWTDDVAEKADGDGDNRQELAHARTAMAEDRTILANERTYAGWMRTGMAAVGIGLAFNALFVSMDPWWVPRAIATAFFVTAVVILFSAERRACSVVQRLHAHKVETVGVNRLRIITILVALAIIALIVALWMLPIDPSGRN